MVHPSPGERWHMERKAALQRQAQLAAVESAAAARQAAALQAAAAQGTSKTVGGGIKYEEESVYVGKCVIGTSTPDLLLHVPISIDSGTILSLMITCGISGFDGPKSGEGCVYFSLWTSLDEKFWMSVAPPGESSLGVMNQSILSTGKRLHGPFGKYIAARFTIRPFNSLDALPMLGTISGLRLQLGIQRA